MGSVASQNVTGATVRLHSMEDNELAFLLLSFMNASNKVNYF